MKLILGSMTFGDQVDQDSANTLIDAFLGKGYTEIDTAHTYCKGKTERMLGRLLPSKSDRSIYIASKVNPWNNEGLQPHQVRKQFSEILERLKRENVDLLYLHSPDLETPVAQTLEACFDLYQEGRFRAFGLSNFAAWQVAEVVELCRSHGWMQPTVYQGMYNALTRDVERELFPCLRNYGISFYAYNPLAGGLLTGKHMSMENIPQSGRFKPDRGYLDRYWREDYFGVLLQLRNACQDLNLKLVEVAMSWLIHHSMLDTNHGDGIILGISSVDHLSQNIAACNHEPLDQSILDILDEGWEIIKPNCFKYFRP